MEIYGVKAKVFIDSELDFDRIAEKIGTAFNLINFEVECSEYPPYEKNAMYEVLGFELWLENSKEYEEYAFVLKIETSHSTEESLNDKMYDVSPWLSRYVSEICELNCSSPK